MHQPCSGTSCAPGQMLVLIGSDGKKAMISRAIATEASYVLRDLLDGLPGGTDAADDSPMRALNGGDGIIAVESSSSANRDVSEGPAAASPTAAPPPALAQPAGGEGDLFLVGGAETGSDCSTAPPAAAGAAEAKSKAPNTATAQPDVLDMLFSSVGPSATTVQLAAAQPVASSNSTAPAVVPPATHADPAPFDRLLGGSGAVATETRATASPPAPAPAAPTVHVSVAVPQQQQQQPARPCVPVLTAPEALEMPFPYFTGDILQFVCRHMALHYRASSFGAGDDGYYRVYPVKTREIPRPMILPLSEYLDPHDRRLLEGWDEVTTATVLKCAVLLNYELLVSLASAKLATYLMDRSIDGIRTLLGVDSDFTPAEETELRKENHGDHWR